MTVYRYRGNEPWPPPKREKQASCICGHCKTPDRIESEIRAAVLNEGTALVGTYISNA